MIMRGFRAGPPAWDRARLTFAAVLMSGVSTAPALAAGTPAGTNIENTATATYDQPGGGEASITSNTVSLKVDELLDVSVASADPGDVVTSPGATQQVLRFTLTNAGNGEEAFVLSAEQAIGGDDFDPSAAAIVLDSNGNGAYDARIDTAYVGGSNDPVLQPDATGAAGDASGRFLISHASVAFVKSATVADPFGGTTQVPGGTITYTLVATVGGSGGVANLKVTDPVPDGATYKAGSLTLDGTALSDAADSDKGHFTGSGIAVSLGDIAAGASRTITFQVKID